MVEQDLVLHRKEGFLPVMEVAMVAMAVAVVMARVALAGIAEPEEAPVESEMAAAAAAAAAAEHSLLAAVVLPTQALAAEV